MANNNEIQADAARAFDAFTKKFNRFKTIHQGEATPKPVKEKSPEILSQERINQMEEQFRLEIIEHYRRFMNPFGTLGAKSNQAAEIASDEENLFAAYNLFKGIQDLNENSGTEKTRITKFEISSNIASKERYLSGGEFIYLQCWLFYEKNVTDFIAQLEGNLHFVPARFFKLNYQQKEICSIIRECFYPGAKEI